MVVVHVVSPRAAAGAAEAKARAAPEAEKFAAAVARAVPEHAAAPEIDKNILDGSKSGAVARAAVKQPEAEEKSLQKRKGEAAGDTAPVIAVTVTSVTPAMHAPPPPAAARLAEEARKPDAPAAKAAVEPQPVAVSARTGNRPAPEAAAPPIAASPPPASFPPAPPPRAAAAAKPVFGPAREVAEAGRTPQAAAPPVTATAPQEAVSVRASAPGAPPVRPAARGAVARPAPATPAAKAAVAAVTSAARPDGWAVQAAGRAANWGQADGPNGAAPMMAGPPAPAPLAEATSVAVAAPPAPVAAGETAKTAASLAAAVTAMTREGRTALSMKLDPPALGNLSIHLAVGDDAKVNVLLVAAVPQTAQAFAAGADHLRQAFVHAGIDLGQLNVGGGKADSQSGQPQGEPPPADEPNSQAAPALASGVRAIA